LFNKIYIIFSFLAAAQIN